MVVTSVALAAGGISIQ